VRRLKLIFWLSLIAVALFVPAGTLAWPGAWIFLVLFIACQFAVMAWLKRHDPALFEQRTRAFHQPGQPRWDKVIGQALVVVWYAWLVLMGLDTQWAGSLHTPVVAVAVGALLLIAAHLLIVRAFKANTFATTAVRLQDERGQTVIDSGPYAWVRHPIYLASLAIHIGTALLLGARWGLLVLPVLALLIGLRTVLEERTLRGGLPGYCDYMTKVRYRLVPLIW
jgi:protein-S-isoprenylcysteine O-methyltransferase Ste14